MRKIFVSILLVNLLCGAGAYNTGYDVTDLDVLKNLDIDENFVKEDEFLSMKNELSEDDKREFILKNLDNANIFVPIIKDMIKEAGVPEPFLYLAMVESLFSIKSTNNSLHSGLWQMGSETATRFGLKIDKYVDERKDPIKSTKIAIDYFKYLYSMFGKWYLVAIAYNCGEGQLEKAIRTSGSSDLNVLISPNTDYLPETTKQYVRKVLSFAIISNNTNYLISDDLEHLLNRGSIYPISAVTIKGGVKLKDLAESIDCSVDEIKRLNKHLKCDYLPPYADSYEIYIPYNKLALFKANFERHI